MQQYKPKIPNMHATSADGEVCEKCQKKVFFTERVKSNGKIYHKTCFHCEGCDHVLTLGQENPGADGKLYCKPCYNNKFGAKKFTTGFVDNSANTSSRPGTQAASSTPTESNLHSELADAHSHLKEATEALASVTNNNDQHLKDLEEMRKMAEELEKLTAGLGKYSKFDDFLNKLDEVRKEYPGNRTAKYLTREIFNSYTPEQQEILYKCAKSGVDNPNSGLGCYAMRPTDYREFSAFFNPLIRDYHRASPTARHITDWDLSNVGNNGVLDVSELGLAELSMRVRVGRNLKQFNLPGAMDKAERIAFEKNMLKAFDELIANPEFGGRVYSLTPDFGNGEANPNLISDEEYQKLVDDHIMFKDMSADPYLTSAGIANDWPYGRGCYVSVASFK